MEATYKAVCLKPCTVRRSAGEAPRHVVSGDKITFVGIKPPDGLFDILTAEGVNAGDDEKKRKDLHEELKLLGGVAAHNISQEKLIERITEILAEKLKEQFGVDPSGMDLEEMRKVYQHKVFQAAANPPKDTED